MRLSPDQPHRGAMDPPAPPPDGQLLRDDDVRAPAVFCLEKCSVNVSKWGLNGVKHGKHEIYIMGKFLGISVW
jgi:hypothetical protein